MKRSIPATIFAAALVLLVPGIGHAEGSIAYGNGRGGISYNFRGPRGADDRALQECGGNCRIVDRFSGTCAAIATGRNGGYGFAKRDRKGMAERSAIDNCEREGNRGCSIATSGCDDS